MTIRDHEGRVVLPPLEPLGSLKLRHLPSTPLPDVVELPPEVGWMAWDQFCETTPLPLGDK